MKKVLLAVCAVALFAGASFAATPIQLSLWDKIAVPPSDAVHGLVIGIGNYTPELRGVSYNFIFAKTDDAIGLQSAIVTKSNEFAGLQAGFVNFNCGEVTGVQYGFFNKAKSVKGLQLGFVNMTEDMQGIQVGLLNFIKTGPLKFMVIANAKF
ncbi:MAG: hypothetical protein FWD54_07375 [Endomicrobia bacterium]|nr:hypothetical protein [Endomicrobiia bacterium]MCL2800074.1 hypothetical protein [Endomicrobiia bacterium]